MAAAEVAVAVDEVVQRPGEVVEKGRIGGGELAADRHGFFGRGNRVVVATEVAVVEAEVGQRPGEVGRKAGLVAASWRRIVTASSVGATASWRRPRLL